MNIHDVKCTPLWFEYCLNGLKTFEVRKDDRNYRKGDILVLQEWNPATVMHRKNEGYTGREARFEITLVLYAVYAKGIQPGYCVMGIRPFA